MSTPQSDETPVSSGAQSFGQFMIAPAGAAVLSIIVGLVSKNCDDKYATGGPFGYVGPDPADDTACQLVWNVSPSFLVIAPFIIAAVCFAIWLVFQRRSPA